MQEVVSKANKILGMIKRNFTDRTKETILPLYKSLVRPHLDYCSQIWNPYYVKDIKLIEGVQRRATKLVESVKDLHYDERLNIGLLDLMRLDKRRDRSDLIETFKILNGNYKVDKELFFVPDDGGRRRHSKKLFKTRCRLDKNLLLAIELLITGTVFQRTVRNFITRLLHKDMY